MVLADAEAADKSDAFIPENVEKKLAEVVQARGKRNTDTKKQSEILRKLVDLAETPALKVSCMLLLVAIQFDRAISLVSYLPASEWATYANGPKGQYESMRVC